MYRMPFTPAQSARRRRDVADGVRDRREERFARMREQQQATRSQVDSSAWREETLRRLRDRQQGS